MGVDRLKPAASHAVSTAGDKVGFCVALAKNMEYIVEEYFNINMSENYQRDEHRIHRIVYHLVWTPKRHKAVLTGDIAADCKALIEKKCSEMGWTILALAIQPDHVHLFVQAWPVTSAAEIVKVCKGLTSHELRLKYPVLKRLPSLWTRSYFAASAGNVSAEVIQGYIAAQKGL
jgi:putative transposase